MTGDVLCLRISLSQEDPGHASTSLSSSINFHLLAPDQTCIMVATDPQTQSNFITRLPYDIRAAIYKELWPSWGPRQHVVWHLDPSADETKSHLHREPCISQFRVHDELQAEIEVLRQEKQVPRGEPLNDVGYRQRLESCWMNHWKCGEWLDEELGEKRNFFNNTSVGGCWCDEKPRRDRDTYLPMLLSCKLM